jgi:hypothetical protein
MGFSNKRAARPGPVPAGCIPGMSISSSGWGLS